MAAAYAEVPLEEGLAYPGSVPGRIVEAWRQGSLADVVEPQGVREANLRDPADQPVLLTLLAANADYLISGDKDLLALAEQYSIITPAQFWARHGG
ncbi:MAG: DNA-binding protein, partial [Gammaproteobacteria bacterium]